MILQKSAAPCYLPSSSPLSLTLLKVYLELAPRQTVVSGRVFRATRGGVSAGQNLCRERGWLLAPRTCLAGAVGIQEDCLDHSSSLMGSPKASGSPASTCPLPASPTPHRRPSPEKQRRLIKSIRAPPAQRVVLLHGTYCIPRYLSEVYASLARCARGQPRCG